ncbi:hypothetical protein Tco_0074201 [Tanacetum coccineum]
MSNRHQELASPEQTALVNDCYPKQTDLGKDISNPLIVDSLLKTIWLSMHHVIAMKHWCPKTENKKAGALSKIASTNFAYLTKQVLVEELSKKSIDEIEVLAVMEEEGDTWMTPNYKYFTEKEKARAIRRKSRWYAVISGVQYKKSYLGPWLRCVEPLQANYVLREIHEGSCSMYVRTRYVVEKSIRT